VYPLGNYLFLFDRNINSININDLNTPIDSSSTMNLIRSNKAIRDGLYYRFANFDENQFLNKDELLITFLEKFDIRFVIISKYAKTPEIILINTKKFIQDSISGEKFIEL